MAFVTRKMCSRWTMLALLLTTAVSAQQPQSGMTQQRLHDLIVEQGSNVFVAGNMVRFQFGRGACRGHLGSGLKHR